jgi:HSP20 family protein
MYGLNKNEGSLYDLFQGAFNDVFAKEMKTNIVEDDESYTLEVEVPGITKDMIEISYQDDYLTIKAGKNQDNKDNKNYLRRERVSMEMTRSFYLEGVDENDIKAKMENGILFINLKKLKKQEDVKKTIMIE